MRQMLGLSDAWSGVINDTASTSTLVALLCARERASNYSLARGGLQEEAKPLVVYASAHSHSSVEKAALLAGFGKAHVRIVPHDGSYAMRPESLENDGEGRHPERPSALRRRRDDRHDDVHRARSARRDRAASRGRNNMWLHVDAAMAGSAMILPECRWMWEGVERADSLIVNAHKWLGAVFDCTIYFVRDPEHLVRVMSTNPSYLQTAADGRVKNYRDWGLPLGRRFRALKLWFLIREQGVEGLQARLRRDIDNAKWLAARDREYAGLARACAGAAADVVRAPRAAGARRRGARQAHARVGGASQSIGRGLPDAGDARRPLDGARLDRRGADRARARRATVAADARRARFLIDLGLHVHVAVHVRVEMRPHTADHEIASRLLEVHRLDRSTTGLTAPAGTGDGGRAGSGGSGRYCRTRGSSPRYTRSVV